MGNQNSIKKTNLYADKIGEESQGAFEGRYRDYRYIDDTLEALSLNYPIWTISLEEDNPFDGIGEDSDFGGDEDSGADTGGADDNPFGGDAAGSDDGGGFGGDDNPFGGDAGGGDDGGNPFGGGGDDDFFGGGDDDSNDFFGGGDDSDDGDGKQKKKEIKLNRKEIIEQEYDVNKQVRSIFPKRFLELQDVIKANISMCEKVVIQDASHIEIFDKLIAEYNRLAKIVDDYLAVIIEKPHDDIFSTYFTIFTNLSKLKDIYNDLLNNDEKLGK
jgi:hypothetical protein